MNINLLQGTRPSKAPGRISGLSLQAARPQPWPGERNARPQPWPSTHLPLACKSPGRSPGFAVLAFWPKHQAAAMGLLCRDGQAAAVANRNCQAAAAAFAEKAYVHGRSHATILYVYREGFILAQSGLAWTRCHGRSISL